MIRAMVQWEHLPRKHEDRNVDLKAHKNGIIYPLVSQNVEEDWDVPQTSWLGKATPQNGEL